MADRLLSVEDAAKMLGRTTHAIYRLVERRRIPFRKDGRRVLFKESELEAYMNALPGVSVDEAIEQLGERQEWQLNSFVMPN